MRFLLGFSVIILLSTACKKDDPPVIAEYDDTPYTLDLVHTNLPAPILPEDNPLTISKVELGRMLFYDNLLSRDASISCASCHIQSDGFSDPSQFSVGVDGSIGGHQAMAVFNIAWNENGFFWDGRAELLRHQSLLPIQDELEMDETLANVITKLSNEDMYKEQFIRAFGTEVVTKERISLALEAFMFSIVSDDSKYDRYLAGTETLTPSEERGRQLFFTEYNPFFPDESGADCAHCHSGNNFENDLYMNNGLDGDAEIDDIGYKAVTGNPEDRGKFKVTSLRNIAITRPYMHDGRFNTLMEVLDHYNEGIQNSATLDPALAMTMDTGLMLTEEDKVDLINYMKTLTDNRFLTNPAYQSPF